MAAIRIGIIHGHQTVFNAGLDALSSIVRQRDMDVLVSGHTHVFQAVEYDGRFFIQSRICYGYLDWGVYYRRNTFNRTTQHPRSHRRRIRVPTHRGRSLEWRKDTEPALSQSRPPPPPPGTAVAAPSLPGPGVSAALGVSNASGGGGGSASPTGMVSPPPAAASVWG